MRSNCICNSVTGVVCADHAYLRSLEHICLRCGHTRGNHARSGSTACFVIGGCAARCNGFVTLDDVELPRGPQPPTEEAITEARTAASIKIRRAMSSSYINTGLMDEALEAVAEFVRMRNG